jgi:hypothetical protein
MTKDEAKRNFINALNSTYGALNLSEEASANVRKAVNDLANAYSSVLFAEVKEDEQAQETNMLDAITIQPA